MTISIEPLPQTPCTLLQAMAREEGWYAHEDEPTRPQRNNNPLDLTYCGETISAGAVSSDGRFAQFADAADGWNAARRWLLVPAHLESGHLVAGYCGASLEQVINRFAPPAENQTSAYLANVCTWAGLTPQSIVTAEMINQ